MKNIGRIDMNVSSQASSIILSFDKFLIVTPKNRSSMMLPVAGARTPLERLVSPVSIAKIVPSMFFGVIFANNTIMGRSKKAMEQASKNID